ncbi:MAG: SUMF1/EgtB/PvdO family nonheme iron enzyme [Myxococcales bacterium]|nr:SUMF1/EgtB/PvdO family nonheme iron enzyme [Myxococcales bacterium]
MILTFPLQTSAPSGDKNAWLGEARRLRDDVERQLCELDQLRDELFALHAEVRPWDGPAKKERLWEAEQLLPIAEQTVQHEVSAVVEHYQRVLDADPDCEDTRLELAAFYWHLASWSEERGDELACESYLALLGQLDDGRYADLIEGTGTLSLESDPPGARVRIARLEQQQRRLVESDFRDLGVTPVGPIDLAPGSYVIEMRLKGHAPTRKPLKMTRGSHVSSHVSLTTGRAIGPDFVHVPAGRFQMGGDMNAAGGGAPRAVFVDNFAIARYPVTIGEYLLFLDDVAADDPGRALRYTPRYGAREAADPRLPVTGISYEAAADYCTWLSARTGVVHHLPTEEQWEKACRGVDGRAFPWGDVFDASYCHARNSRPGRPHLAPVGSAEHDMSIYGARDMAGLVSEWTQTREDEADDAEAYVVRGGSFEETGDACRAARRMRVGSGEAMPSVGFRTVRPLAPGGGDTITPPMVPTIEAPSNPRRRPVDLAAARSALFGSARELTTSDADHVLGELLERVVALSHAERGFVIERVADGKLTALCCRTAGAEEIPRSDQQYDAEIVHAALRQARTIDLGPMLAIPLPGARRCVLLQRRFAADAFADDERLVAGEGADAIALALRIGDAAALPSPDAPATTTVAAAGAVAAREHATLDEAVSALERELLSRTLREEHNNISRTARRLGLSRNGLRARLRRYSINV